MDFSSSQFHEAMFKVIMQRSEYFVGIIDPLDWNFKWVNEFGAIMFGISNPADCLPHLSTVLFKEKNLLESLKEAFQQNKSWDITTRYETQTRKYFYGKSHFEIFFYQQHKMVLLTIYDVTDQKAIEFFLRTEKQRFEILFNDAKIGIILVDDTGAIELINKHAEEQFGYNHNELNGEKIEILLPDDLRKKHVFNRNQFLAEPHSRPMGIGMNLLAKRKNGTLFPVEISLSYYRINNEIKVIAFVIDITLRQQMDDAIRQQKAILEQKVKDRTKVLQEALNELENKKNELSEALEKEKELNDLKSRFVTMASHEFRTPLSTVLSSASLISQYRFTEDQSKREKHIHRIKDNVNNLTGILNEFLSLGKLEEGRMVVTKEKFNLQEFLKEVCEQMETLLRQGQQLFYRHAQNENIVFTDKGFIKNILINLVSNAIKFSPEGSPIEVISKIERGSLFLDVKDYGIGIGEDDKKHLFERFFRASNVTNIQGTGLGLHIVKKYVEILDGEINFESKLNKGTTFYIKIPL